MAGGDRPGPGSRSCPFAGALGFPAAERLGGGTANGPPAAVAVVNGEGVFGDVHGHDLAGVRTADGDPLAGDGDDPAVRHPPLDRDRLDRGPRWWSGRAGSAQPPAWP